MLSECGYPPVRNGVPGSREHDEGQYAFGLVTSHLHDHDRATALENTVRDRVGLPAP